MLEFTFIIYFLLLFIFPLQMLAITLGLVTTWHCFQKYQLSLHQPPEGKKVLRLKSITTACNIVLSVIVSVAMAFMIHILIFTHWILFIFNFVFSLIIALRWFDFTHLITRHYIIKFGANFKGESTSFVEITGLKTRSGRLSGHTPVLLDAGGLRWQNSEWTTPLQADGVSDKELHLKAVQATGYETHRWELIFDGVFYKQRFSSQNTIQVEKKSLDRIKIVLKNDQDSKPDICIISFREQFYPFKSREKRDTLYQNIMDAWNQPVLGETPKADSEQGHPIDL